MTDSALTTSPLDGAGIILVRPRYPENIGAAARVAHNFGITELRLVADTPPDQERMLKMATHHAAHLIKGMQMFSSTAAAAEPFNFIVATTARQGRHRALEQSPREVMTEVAPLVQGNRVGLMFGPENAGLQNDDLDLCQFASTIPTADFSSLNLAQAVGIHCYELFTALGNYPLPSKNRPEFANSYDLEGMYEHIDDALTQVTFLSDTNQTYWMRSIRQFFSRMRLTKRDASMIRGICRKFLWYQTQGPGSN